MHIQVLNRIWINKDGKPFLGSGRIALLELIDESGSISKAAQALDMSYKKAWQLVRSINQQAKEPVVIKESGGKNGGGTKLTEQGKNLIAEFRKLEQKSKEFLHREIDKCCID